MSREPTDIAAEARTLLDALANSTDPTAFQTLLGLSQYVGECLGISARTLAEAPVLEQRCWSRRHHQTGRLVAMAPLTLASCTG